MFVHRCLLTADDPGCLLHADSVKQFYRNECMSQFLSLQSQFQESYEEAKNLSKLFDLKTNQSSCLMGDWLNNMEL